MPLLTSGADIHDWDCVISKRSTESASPSAPSTSDPLLGSLADTAAAIEGKCTEGVQKEAACANAFSRCDTASPSLPGISWAAVKARAKQGFTDKEVSLGVLKYQMMTVLATRSSLAIFAGFQSVFHRLMGKSIRLKDYGLKRLTDLAVALPDVVQLSATEMKQQKITRGRPAVKRGKLQTKQPRFSLVLSPQNLRTLALIQSRLRLVVHRGLVELVADAGESWVPIDLLQKKVEQTVNQPLEAILTKHKFSGGGAESQLVWRFVAMLQEMPDVVRMRMDPTGQVCVQPVGGPEDCLVAWKIQNPLWDRRIYVQ
ncbi:hypothetical protein CLOM_g6080 [Closterium sp. NIES-68]|nr:hypothetical protein CLOM_g9629 [Closterium sp. NIES-68]GJP46826.1 hypothetical protein CLOM_g6080 [Closterium sp. NIES-68]GJP57751.1 hypothetical protein CLOP_g17316 [Closterium sp. NIES-67]